MNRKKTGALKTGVIKTGTIKTGTLLMSAGLLSAVLLSGCTTLPKSESLTMTGTYFDTVVQIEVWGADQDMIEHCRKM